MADDSDSSKPKKPATKIAAWVLMGLLVIGLGGFGFENLGGGVTSIGRVGDRDIKAQDYARALQQEVSAFSAQVGQPITTQQALAFGLDRQVLQSLVTRTALDMEAARVGLSVGDQTVAEEIAGTAAFQGTAGGFDRETYRFALDRINMTEAEFETGLREDLARSLLQGAVAGGFSAPPALTDTLYAYIAERRGFGLLRLTEASLPTPLPAPTDDDLKAFHTANLEALFTAPEAKRITYVALLPDQIAATQVVDETTLRAMYDERIDEFVVAERRLVERVVYPDDAAAAAARARLDAGATFEDLVAERGLTLNDVDLGDVSRADLGAAGEAVFALTEPGVAGPVASDLGPALFRMNGILSAEETTFDEARTALAAELQTDSARREIAAKLEAIDDLLAGGAALTDLQTEMGMTLATIDYVPGRDDGEGIAAYTDFREAADALADGDFPEAITLADGGIVAMQLDEVVPPTPIPFDTARADVESKWRADALSRALGARAATIRDEVAAGAALSAYGIVDRTPGIARDGFVEGTPPTLIAEVFKMTAGEARVIEAPDFVGVVVLDSIQPAATTGEDATALKDAIAVQAQQAISNDAFTAFTNALTTEAGISLNQPAINAVNTQFQ